MCVFIHPTTSDLMFTDDPLSQFYLISRFTRFRSLHACLPLLLFFFKEHKHFVDDSDPDPVSRTRRPLDLRTWWVGFKMKRKSKLYYGPRSSNTYTHGTERFELSSVLPRAADERHSDGFE